MYRVLGKSEPRTYAAEKSRGEARFAGDLFFPNMLFGKILRSPHPHARLLSIDTSRAQRLPGVKAVVTHKDVPPVRIGRWIRDRYILARDRVRHIGEPVAAVAAVDEDTALEALSLIKVEYEPLPAVFDAIEAMREGSPILHEELQSYGVSLGPRQNSPGGNICHQVHLKMGDVEKAWASADIVSEDRFTTQSVHHGFIQTHEAVSTIDASGKVTLLLSGKAPFQMRNMVTQALQIPMSSLRVIATRVGGDHGGKGTANMEPVCVLLTLKTGLPVRMIMTWEEEFTATFIRTRSFSRVKTGVKKDGTIVALQGEIIFDCGAYNDSLAGMSRNYNMLQGPYFVPNVDIEGKVVYTNNTPTGHVRAPRGPQPLFAIESHLDSVARKLGMDPLELRLKNALKDGDPLAAGGRFYNPGLKETIKAAMDYVKREKKESEEKNVGWGVACAEWALHPLGEEGPLSSIWVKLNEDGTVVILTGCTEQGGGQHDILIQIVAEILRLPVDRVSVVAADTDATPYEQPTGASMTAYRTGNSARLAAEDARQQILNFAAELLRLPAEELELDQGRVFHRSNPEHSVPLSQIGFASLSSPHGAIMGIGSSLREQNLAERKKFKDSLEAAQLGTHAVKLRVDPETGEVKILKYFASHDVGFALHPMNIEGQINGAVAFGVGYALTEDIVRDRGKVLNAKLTDYRLPRATDVPNVQSSIVESPSKFGPFGAKGIGEPPLMAVAPAIANAIYDAVDVRITELPITKEKIWKALREARAGCAR
jgi:CO/xanthine dehydrogenase Mo-binding subunit